MNHGSRWLRRIARSLGLAIAILALTETAAHADDYPSKPIRLIVPFSPGGSTDILARILAPELGKALHQSVIVEAKAGAASIIGTQMVAHAPADGYTLLLTNVAFAINPALRGKDLSYDLKDFAPVTLLASQPTVLVTNSALSASSLQSLIALAKKEPGQLNFATAGVGSVGHMAGAMFEAETGVKMTHVPYQGGGTADVGLVSGDVMLGFLGAPPLMTYEKAGKVKFLALTDGRRSAALPGVPTLAELGLKGFSVDNWIGMLAPAGTPATVVSRLFTEVGKIMKEPEIAKRLVGVGFEPWISESPHDYQRFLENDIAKYRKAAQSVNVNIK